jgi:hypothetical protein
MFVILHALGVFVADMFKSRCRLQAENLFLRHQLNVAACVYRKLKPGRVVVMESAEDRVCRDVADPLNRVKGRRIFAANTVSSSAARQRSGTVFLSFLP